MNLLLDTHILLWWLDDHPALRQKYRRAIAEGNNLVFVSAASVWEIRIKAALGKLIIPSNFEDVLDKQDFEPLPITLAHAHGIAQLPNHHQDPFARILIVQAKLEGFTLVTHDRDIRRYDVSVL